MITTNPIMLYPWPISLLDPRAETTRRRVHWSSRWKGLWGTIV